MEILILNVYVLKTKMMNVGGDVKLVILNNFKKKSLYKKMDTLYIVAKIR